MGGRHRASPIHRRRARAASFITAYLLLSRTASANPPEQCATFARSINLSRDFPQATWNYRERESLIEPTPGSTDPERFATVSTGIGDRVLFHHAPREPRHDPSGT